MRKTRILNVSYGEDYAAALRICGNTGSGESMKACIFADAGPEHRRGPHPRSGNRNDAFKDKVRTEEILARQKMMKAILNP